MLSRGDVLTEHGKNAVALARYERTWPPRAGNAGCATTEPLPPGLVRSTQALLAGLGWQGLFELELIGTPDGEWVPVDLDPRPFGSLALASAGGAPLAVAWCRVLLGERPAPAVARPVFAIRWERRREVFAGPHLVVALGLGGLACGGDFSPDPDVGGPRRCSIRRPRRSRAGWRWEPGGDDARVERYNIWRSTSGSGTWTRLATTSCTGHTEAAVSQASPMSMGYAP